MASVSFLIAITRREQVAQIFGRPIFVVTDVALVPLSSQSEAEKGISAAVRQKETAADTDEDSSDAESTVEESDDVHSAEDAHEAPSPSDDVRTKSDKGDTTATTNIAEDVFARRGPYGKFASQWLTKKGWGLPGMRAPSRVPEATPELDLTTNSASIRRPTASSTTQETNSRQIDSPALEHAPESRPSGQGEDAASPSEREYTLPLLSKLLRSTRLILSSRSFYFSYDFNITRRMGDPRMLPSKPLLHEDIDPLVYTHALLACTPGVLTTIVLLESELSLSIHECGFSSISDAYHARLCWPAAVHSQEGLSRAHAYGSIRLAKRHLRGGSNQSAWDIHASGTIPTIVPSNSDLTKIN